MIYKDITIADNELFTPWQNKLAFVDILHLSEIMYHVLIIGIVKYGQ